MTPKQAAPRACPRGPVRLLQRVAQGRGGAAVCAHLPLVSGGMAGRTEADSLVARGAASAAARRAGQLGMDRRRFLAALAGGPLAPPLVAEAQQAVVKVYRLGLLCPGTVPGPSDPTVLSLLPTVLRERGYIEGQNLLIERRFADDKPDRLPGLARELVQIQPDIIVALSGLAVKAARDATTTIPIVMLISADPVP